MQTLTLAEAIEQGFQYCVIGDDETVTPIEYIKDPDDIEELRERGAFLCHNEPVFYSISPETLREIIADHVQAQDEIADPDGELGTAVEEMPDSDFAPLAEAINKATECVCSYKSAKIKLIP